VPVGATQTKGDYYPPGYASLYQLVNDNWIQIGDDILGDIHGDYFGWYTALSADGTILAVGVPLQELRLELKPGTCVSSAGWSYSIDWQYYK